MAKDDYFVLVYKILSYLYAVLKEGRPPEEKLLRHDSPLLGVNEVYWTYIMEHLALSPAWPSPPHGAGQRWSLSWITARSRQTASPT